MLVDMSPDTFFYRFAGENFAVFRTFAGVVHILDAYCPHLGANMAVGGVVRGDCLECPFHLWRFKGEDGKCSAIPYSDKGNATDSSRNSVYKFLRKCKVRTPLAHNQILVGHNAGRRFT
jgi:phenylpropionate dioxygenase-like ring-hydroxylating dioxygenase large terminal subunit